MRLRDLAQVVTAAPPARLADGVDPEVVDVVHDSRDVRPGVLFCCVRGEHHDGHEFAPSARAAGAVALLVDHVLDLDLPQILVPDVRSAMAPIAAACFGDPSRSLTVVGVTGTNGKTTTALMLAQVLIAAGRRVEVLGTLTGARTTPEATDLQRLLGRWRDDGVEVVVMEVSSHALALHRVDHTRFRVAIFTNLSRDHLDFHHSMEQYFEAKAALFTPALSDRAVVNLDSPHGRLLADTRAVPTSGYSLEEVTDLSTEVAGSSFRWRGHRVDLGLAGRFNVSNALAAAHAALALGLDEATVARGLSAPLVVPGRFERATIDADFTVVVDFAHTPDGLENVLIAADQVVGDRGRVIVVFGCGGDRDRTKRAPMGAVAAERADVVVLTADNSRSESTPAIIGEILTGCDRAEPRRAAAVITEPDRREAIRRALAEARAGDIVVIAGKGHESTLTIGDTVVPFDDRVVVEEVHNEMRAAS